MGVCGVNHQGLEVSLVLRLLSIHHFREEEREQ